MSGNRYHSQAPLRTPKPKRSNSRHFNILVARKRQAHAVQMRKQVDAKKNQETQSDGIQ